MKRRLSLRIRITLGALAVVLVVLGGAGLLIIDAVQRHMTNQIDDSLHADADFTERLMTRGSGLPTAEGPTDLYVQFISVDGGVAASGAAAEGRPALGEPAAAARPRITSASDSGLGDLRVLTMRAPTNPSLTLVLARSTRSVSEVHDALVQLLIWVLAGTSVALAVLIWIVVGRSLRPVEQMRRSVDQMGTDDLSQRLRAPRTGDELDRLAGTLNALLERLDTAVERERQFVADASHELRTPITAMRTILQTETMSPSRVISTRADALAQLTGLQELVDQLLVLALTDASKGPPTGPVDLDELVLAQASQLRRTTSLRIDTSSVSGGQVLGRDTDLGRLIDNLAANAARYAASSVTFAVCQRGKCVQLVIDDDGPGIDAADRDRIFERFATVDESRAANQSGAGLGLAIAAAIVASHHGRIGASDAPSGGARLTVELPVFVPGEAQATPVTA